MTDSLNKKEQITISVRRLVEFILRSGDIDTRFQAAPENAMQEGSRIHRMIQRRTGPEYESEVSLSYCVEGPDYDLCIQGRADGIIHSLDGEVTIDEIKGIYKDLTHLNEPYGVHLAQAKCYAYIFAKQNELNEVGIQMTYCNIDTEEIRYFKEKYSMLELENWFIDLIDEYKKWARFQYDWKLIRMQSIHHMEFPYDYRIGQKELASQVYRTIYHEKRLFIEAPTGVGKTISTVFPSIKAMGEEKGEKLFYLTAKTITASVAVHTFDVLRGNGLRFKTVSVTAKEKMCLQETCECTPEACPYAKGHYDRINEAMYHLLTTEDAFTRETIIEYAKKFNVCPFEYCLDMSIFSDGVICDYNYVFDPNVYLRRFFSDGVKGEYLFLVDEAHNLVDRAREMYSASLYKEDFLSVKKLVKQFDSKLNSALESCNKLLLEYKRESEQASVLESADAFLIALTRCAGRLEQFLEEDEGSKIRQEVLEFYFQVRHFLNMGELLDDSYVIYTECESDNRFMIKLFCVHPANNLQKCLEKGRSTIFFSATLLPITYYMELLSSNKDDYAVYAASSFDESKRGVFIGTDVSTKYSRRCVAEYQKIASYILDIASKQKGHYLVFFPSYRFMQDVYDEFILKIQTENLDDLNIDISLQMPSMSEGERELFLYSFENHEAEERTLLGFCVMGGIFSEGIDLTGESLIGAMIIGTGLPQICSEREILRHFFDGRGLPGFDYAYRYPGMNKVLQSAGRVIRTAEDVGIVVLLDERFCQHDYKTLFPREWERVSYLKIDSLGTEIDSFWHNMNLLKERR